MMASSASPSGSPARVSLKLLDTKPGVLRYSRDALVKLRSSTLATALPDSVPCDIFKKSSDVDHLKRDLRDRKLSNKLRPDPAGLLGIDSGRRDLVDKKAELGSDDSQGQWQSAEDRRQLARRERKTSLTASKTIDARESRSPVDKERRLLAQREKGGRDVDIKVPQSRLSKGKGEPDKDFDRKMQEMGERRRTDRKDNEGRKSNKNDEQGYDGRRIEKYDDRRRSDKDSDELEPEWMTNDIHIPDDNKNDETFDLGGPVDKGADFDFSQPTNAIEQFMTKMRKQHGKAKARDNDNDGNRQQSHQSEDEYTKESIDPIEQFRRQMREQDDHSNEHNNYGVDERGGRFVNDHNLLHEQPEGHHGGKVFGEPTSFDAQHKRVTPSESRFAGRFFKMADEGHRVASRGGDSGSPPNEYANQLGAPPGHPHSQPHYYPPGFQQMLQQQQHGRSDARMIENDIRNVLFAKSILPGPGQLRRDLNIPLPLTTSHNTFYSPRGEDQESMNMILAKLQLHNNNNGHINNSSVPGGIPHSLHPYSHHHRSIPSSRGNTPPMSPRDLRPDLLDDVERERILRKKASLMYGGNIPTSVSRQFAGKVDMTKPDPHRLSNDPRLRMEQEHAFLRQQALMRERDQSMMQHDPRTHVQIPRTAQQMSAYYMAQQQQQQQQQQHQQQRLMQAAMYQQQMQQQQFGMGRPRAPLPPGMDMSMGTPGGRPQPHSVNNNTSNPMTPAILQLLQSQHQQPPQQLNPINSRNGAPPPPPAPLSGGNDTTSQRTPPQQGQTVPSQSEAPFNSFIQQYPNGGGGGPAIARSPVTTRET